MDYTLYCGDSKDIAAALPENSIDTIITDPPYGLKFMGKDWDHGIPGSDYWKTFLRVAKPGAILLAFGGTRTFHRLTVAIEDAGWEIRDCIMWLYGSGFPKSYNISKGIDAYAGAERAVLHTVYQKDGEPRANMAGDYSGNRVITEPATKFAKHWDGWGTALKPAWEPIIVAMKPLDGTFVESALTHGVAGLHINAGRIGSEHRINAAAANKPGGNSLNMSKHGMPRGVNSSISSGRWPANIILDELSAEMLDAQSGITQSQKSQRGKVKIFDKAPHGFTKEWIGDSTERGFTDKGGASRFFYCAKASKKERGEGNNHPTVKPIALLEYLCKLTETPTKGVVLDPFMGSGSTALAALQTGRAFVGIDINQEYVTIARRRIEEVTHG